MIRSITSQWSWFTGLATLAQLLTLLAIAVVWSKQLCQSPPLWRHNALPLWRHFRNITSFRNLDFGTLCDGKTIGTSLLNFVFGYHRTKITLCIYMIRPTRHPAVSPVAADSPRDVWWTVSHNWVWLLNAFHLFPQQLKIVGFRNETSFVHNAKHILSQKYVHVS